MKPPPYFQQVAPRAWVRLAAGVPVLSPPRLMFRPGEPTTSIAEVEPRRPALRSRSDPPTAPTTPLRVPARAGAMDAAPPVQPMQPTIPNAAQTPGPRTLSGRASFGAVPGPRPVPLPPAQATTLRAGGDAPPTAGARSAAVAPAPTRSAPPGAAREPAVDVRPPVRSPAAAGAQPTVLPRPSAEPGIAPPTPVASRTIPAPAEPLRSVAPGAQPAAQLAAPPTGPVQARAIQPQAMQRQVIQPPPPPPRPPIPLSQRAAPGLHIGMLEVRVVAPPTAPAPAAATIRAAPRPVAGRSAAVGNARIARGFGVFGIGQS
jgi:hypothetical protein